MRIGEQFWIYYRNSNEPVEELKKLIRKIEEANKKHTG